MNFINKLNMKKIYITLGIIAVLVLLINVGVIIARNTNDNNDFSKNVTLLEQSIIQGNFSESANIYTLINDELQLDSKSLKKINTAINERYTIFITNVLIDGNSRQEDLQLLTMFYDFVEKATIANEINKTYDEYLAENTSDYNALLALASISSISTNTIDTSSDVKSINDIKLSREIYYNGEIKFSEKKYQEAIDLFKKVIPVDYTYYEKASTNIDECISLLKEAILTQSSTLANQGFYLDAYNYLNNYASYFTDDTDINYYINYYKSLEPELVAYNGPIYHVFYHSLIVYPELAFDGDYEDQGYYKYMTTALEFKRMLDEFYQNNFVLVNINSLLDVNKNGSQYHIEKSELMLPIGKKPLVISMDDLSYYDYMKGDGFADKLVLDSNSEVATKIITPEGNAIVSRDGDIVPILDDFVKLHPDFSFNGAKGIIALTGYEGIFGYETHLTESSNYDEEYISAKVIADTLKNSGWLFANHSYTHNNYFKDLTVTMDQLTYDTEKWELQVGSIIGDTNIYISPFGYIFSKDDQRFKYITENKEYYIYCPVGGGATIYYNDSSFVMYRVNLDGKTLKINSHLTEPFFNAEDVIDERRPEYIWN